MTEPNEMSCDEFADVAAEMALGVLTGRERARAISHLGQCDACRENVRQLTMTGEELLGLLPAREPPAGFETRVMERLGLGAAPPAKVGWIRRIGRLPHFGRKPGSTAGNGRVSRMRPRLAVAAAALTVIVSGLGGWGLRAATTSHPASALSSAAFLSATHQPVGRVFFYDGSSRWLYMSVNVGSGNGTVICQVESPNGHVTAIGSFRLANGYGYWGSPYPVNDGPLTGARLITSDGTVLATASFRTT